MNFKPVSLIQILLAVAGLCVVTGCGSHDKKNDDDDSKSKKPAYERVVILKQRFNQLDNSLDEMERELKIQKKQIENAKETAKAIKRSLLKGNLKGYSLDTISTDPIILEAIAKQQQKDEDKKEETTEKESSSDLVVNSLLIAVFVIFLIMIFVVALKDRNQASPYDAVSRATYPEPETDEMDDDISDDVSDASDPSFTYGEIKPKESRKPETDAGAEPENPETKPDDEGPRV